MLTITLGSSHALVTESEPVEFDVEHIFHACNRIDHPGQDMLALYDLAGDRTSARWLVELRGGLDIASAPSMSVNDVVWVTADSGEELGGWVCQPVGFSTVMPGMIDQAELLEGRHVHHIITPASTSC